MQSKLFSDFLCIFGQRKEQKLQRLVHSFLISFETESNRTVLLARAVSMIWGKKRVCASLAVGQGYGVENVSLHDLAQHNGQNPVRISAARTHFILHDKLRRRRNTCWHSGGTGSKRPDIWTVQRSRWSSFRLVWSLFSWRLCRSFGNCRIFRLCWAVNRGACEVLSVSLSLWKTPNPLGPESPPPHAGPDPVTGSTYLAVFALAQCTCCNEVRTPVFYQAY